MLDLSNTQQVLLHAALLHQAHFKYLQRYLRAINQRRPVLKVLLDVQSNVH
jgi:hypothetical protein